MRVFRYVIVALLLLAIGICGWIMYQSLTRPVILVYSFEAQYADMPNDDSTLQEWLAAQPDVSNVTIRREPGTLIISYESPLRETSLDLLSKCDALGYKGRNSFFTNMAVNQ